MVKVMSINSKGDLIAHDDTGLLEKTVRRTVFFAGGVATTN